MKKSRFVSVSLPLATVHVTWLTVFFVIPLGYMAWLSLLTPAGVNTYEDGLSLHNFARLINPPYPQLVLISLGYAVATTLICLVLAFPLALTIAKSPSRYRNLFLIAVILPFWTNTLIRIFALEQILGRRGLINAIGEWLWNATSSFVDIGKYQPLELLYNATGVLCGLVYAFLPFALLPIYASIVKIPTQLLDASRDLGASTWQTVYKVIIPLAKPGIIAAVIVTCIPALGAFFISEILGGPRNVLIGNIIEIQFKKANDWPFGAALSLSILVLTLIAVGLARFRREQFEAN